MKYYSYAGVQTKMLIPTNASKKERVLIWTGIIGLALFIFMVLFPIPAGRAFVWVLYQTWDLLKAGGLI